jgi:hypothetical protein
MRLHDYTHFAASLKKKLIMKSSTVVKNAKTLTLKKTSQGMSEMA